MFSTSAVILIFIGCAATMIAGTYGTAIVTAPTSTVSLVSDPKTQSVGAIVAEMVNVTTPKNETERMLLAGLSHLTSGIGNTLGGLLSHNHGSQTAGFGQTGGSVAGSGGHGGAAQLSSGSNVAHNGQMSGGFGGQGGSHFEFQSSFGNQGAGQFGSQNSGQFNNQMNGQVGSQGSGQYSGQTGGQFGGQVSGQSNGQSAQQGSGQAGTQINGEINGQTGGQFGGQFGGQMGYQGNGQYNNQMNGQVGTQGNGQIGGQGSGNFNGQFGGQFGGNGNGQVASGVGASTQPLCTCQPGQVPVTGGMNTVSLQQAPANVPNFAELIRQGQGSATTAKPSATTKKQGVKG